MDEPQEEPRTFMLTKTLVDEMSEALAYLPRIQTNELFSKLAAELEANYKYIEDTPKIIT